MMTLVYTYERAKHELIAVKFLTDIQAASGYGERMKVDQYVDGLHQQGKMAEANNAHDVARALYGGALALLGDRSADDAVAIQRADILRSDALTYIYEARSLRAPAARATLLRHAGQQLLQAIYNIDPVIDDDLRARLNPGPSASYLLSKEDRRHAYAVRGAALGVLACTRTFEILSHEILTPDTTTAIKSLYREAHHNLRQGDNGLYRVKNAVAAARHQTLFGTSAGKAGWLWRAAYGVVWTWRNDREHYPAARRAFQQHDESLLHYH